MSKLDNDLSDLVIWGVNNCISDVLIEEGFNRSIEGLSYQKRMNYTYNDSLSHFIDFIIYKAQLSLGSDVAQSKWCEVYTPQGFVNVRVSYLKSSQSRFLTLRLIQDQVKDVFQSLVFQQKEILSQILQFRHGMLCFIGQAGSGKSTSLRSFLSLLRHKRIISIEHPIEQHCSFMMQIELDNHNIQTMVYHALRHHPQVLVLEEIRNEHELKVAYEASLSGHLVCMTFHAHDVEMAKTRMLSMIPDFDFSIINAWFIQSRNEDNYASKIQVIVQIEETNINTASIITHSSIV